MSVYLIDYENVHHTGLSGIDRLTPTDEVILFYGNSASTIPMELHIGIANSGAKVQYIRIEKTAKNYLDFQLASMAGYLVGTTRQDHFIIVSNDTGFESVLDLWNGQTFAGRKLIFSRRDQIVEEKSSKKGKGKKAKDSKGKKATKTKEKAQSKDQPKEQEAKEADTQEKAAALKNPLRAKLDKITEAEKKKIRLAVKELGLKPTDYTKVYKVYQAAEDKQAYNNGLVKVLKQEKGNQVYKATVGVLYQ